MTQIRAVFCVCIRWHDWRRENCFLLGIMWCQKKMQWDVIKRPQHVIRMNRCKQRRVLWARFLNAEKLFLHTAKHWSCQLIITKMTTTICRKSFGSQAMFDLSSGWKPISQSMDEIVRWLHWRAVSVFSSKFCHGWDLKCSPIARSHKIQINRCSN